MLHNSFFVYIYFRSILFSKCHHRIKNLFFKDSLATPVGVELLGGMEMMEGQVHLAAVDFLEEVVQLEDLEALASLDQLVRNK